MTENTYNTDCCKWTMEEREKILATGTLEQKKEAFKDDEELMRETTKFVSEVIQMAITEASKRIMFTEFVFTHCFFLRLVTKEKKKIKENKIFVCIGSRLKGIASIAGWNHRARGFCSRILNALCPCFTSNGKS
ncbi:hypothetical protein E2986_07319 [Frieseomelitta varia]|uniref:Uncharacterized protein n=1 Tax=Frieseomelitta varia TaxID=561572 RepID=A0A833W3X6_9HYME|nr:hypothetical protein E2986_07319 [Frieseomelitta varia]